MQRFDDDSDYQAAINIEPMTLDDLSAVAELEALSGLSPWGYDGYQKELERGERTVMLVARPVVGYPARFRVLGFLCSKVVIDEWHINNMATHPKFRRRGIARSLISEGLKLAKKLGAAQGWLEVRASNLAAQELYQQFGFNPIHRRRGYYSNPVEDAIVMCRDLLSDSGPEITLASSPDLY
jgi:ribosomal-protein-alanine N-acetyltransferase